MTKKKKKKKRKQLRGEGERERERGERDHTLTHTYWEMMSNPIILHHQRHWEKDQVASCHSDVAAVAVV